MLHQIVLSVITILGTNLLGTASSADTPCKQGTSMGMFTISFPNRTSIWLVTQRASVKWEYTPQAKNFPSIISLRLQQIPSSLFQTLLLDGVQTDANSHQVDFDVPALSDGEYKVKLIGDYKDTQNVDGSGLNKSVCIQDGDILPGVSAPFKIVNPLPLSSYPDRFGPNEATSIKRVSIFHWALQFFIGITVIIISF